jgi:predicted ATPase
VLIQFRVENHRSLRDEQILSLAATSDKVGTHVLRVEGLGEALVPVVAIYGANASGKSNVLAALSFLRHAVVDSQRTWDVEGTPQDPFRLSRKSSEPSLYEVDVVIDGVRYRYGFQLSASRIEEEWLFAWPHGRKAMWFERDGDRFEFGKTLHGENDAIRGFTRPNSLFLSAAAQNNHTTLLPLFRYFSAWQFSLERGPGLYGRAWFALAAARRLDPQSGAADRDAIMQLLQGADTGIVDVRVEPAREEELDLDLGVQQDTTLRALGSRWKAPTMVFRHRTVDGEHAWLPLASESAGTLALLKLAPPILDTLRSGGLLCIDELEASLHPTLALNVVRLFNDPKHNPHHAQLVFATHDTNLLGSLVGEPALRRDQIWFTEKDENGGTHLYPLTDFHPRKEENLERGYLQGRYGAVPFLGELVGRAAEGEPGGDGSHVGSPDDDEA